MIESKGSEWASRPRVLPPTGRRKGTARFCGACSEATGASVWHSLFPAEPCPVATPRPAPGDVPHGPVLLRPRPGPQRVRFDPASVGL